MERRDFIKSCGFVCLGGAAVSTLFEACGTAAYFAQTTATATKITVKKSEFTIAGREDNKLRNFVLIRTEKFQFPICLYHVNGEEYTALYTECTHKGCEVRPQKEFLVCPCHGSEFTNKGVVQNPPAEQNLKTFNTTTDNENIYIAI